MKKSLSVLSILMAICLSACSGADTIPENPELSSETVISEVSENSPEQSSEKAVSKVSENSPEQSSETDVSEVSENSPEQSSEADVSEISENSPEQSVISEVSQQPSQIEYEDEIPTEWQDNGIFSGINQKMKSKIISIPMSIHKKFP